MEEVSGKNWRVLVGDVRDGLRTLDDNSVHCCVTSPPYWGLRDYGVDGQLGLEPTPESFVASMVEVFEEVRRVLRPDGTLWLNIGDSYAGSWGAQSRGNTAGEASSTISGGSMLSARQIKAAPRETMTGSLKKTPGLKSKDLVGIPWRLAFALQAAGWYLRSEIIWHKRSPMPESVSDRPTKAHEQIFLLTKSERYFYDKQAIAEPCVAGNNGSTFTRGKTAVSQQACSQLERADPETRNVRSVWSLSSESFNGAHFATFPTTIPERAIKAGTSETGCCSSCGAPWKRQLEKVRVATRPGNNTKLPAGWNSSPGSHNTLVGRYKHDLAAETGASPHRPTEFGNRDPQRHVTKITTIGWVPTCNCEPIDPVPCTVLDPFSGSGTTGQVATSMGRIYIGCELNPQYAEMSRERIDYRKPVKTTKKRVRAPVLARQLFE